MLNRLLLVLPLALPFASPARADAPPAEEVLQQILARFQSLPPVPDALRGKTESGAVCDAVVNAFPKGQSFGLEVINESTRANPQLTLIKEMNYQIDGFELSATKLSLSFSKHYEGGWGKTDFGWPVYNFPHTDHFSAQIGLTADGHIASVAASDPDHATETCEIGK